MVWQKTLAAAARSWMNWPLWGGAVTALLLAKHVWVLLAPAEQAIPGELATSTLATPVYLFGSPDVRGPAASLDGFRAVGIFVHSREGFAVLKTPAGQVGVGLGGEVAPGVRLVATHPDHVILERNGARHRVDLDWAAATGHAALVSATQPPVRGMTVPPAGGRLLDPLTPEQKILLQQQEWMKKGSRP